MSKSDFKTCCLTQPLWTPFCSKHKLGIIFSARFATHFYFAKNLVGKIAKWDYIQNKRSNVNLPKTFYIWTDEFLIIYVLQNGLHIFHRLLEHFLPLNHHLLQNDYWFFSGQVFGATKWRLVFIIQKSIKKTPATKWQTGCLQQNAFHKSFFFLSI